MMRWDFIKRCMREDRFLWTYHVNMRLKDRFIPRSMILDSLETYEIIEAYPEDKYLPGYLVWAKHGKTVFHVLFAVDEPNDNVRIVTAYRPRPDEWIENLKSRKLL